MRMIGMATACALACVLAASADASLPRSPVEPSVTASARPDAVNAGKRVTVSGRVTPAARRARVVLERRARGRWTRIATGRTSPASR
jgi:hypothetical protein